MAQHDYDIANGTGQAVRNDINGALGAIVSLNSGATEPATTFAFQLWADTTANVLKLRNSANTAWITLRQLDGDFTTVSVDNGTAAAPSVFFNASGTDTGFYSSGTDAVDVSTAGTRRLGVGSSGNVTVFGGNVTLNGQGDLRFADSDSSNWVAFQSPATVASNITWTLPSADGTSGQALTTNGSGTLSWASAAATTDNITEGNTSAEVVDTGSDGHFKVVTEGTEALRINSSQLVGIGDNAPDSALTVQAAASVTPLRVSGPSSEFSRVDTSGRLLVGTSTGTNNLRLNQKLAVVSTGTDNYSGIGISSYIGTTADRGSVIDLNRSRGTTDGSMTSVADGDTLGWLIFQGADGSNFVPGAWIRGQVDGTPGASDMPGRLCFSTSADGSNVPTERLRIASNGQLSAVVPGGTTLYPGYMCRAWVNFNGTGTVAIRSNGNVTSITDNAVGLYTLNFTTAMPDTDYVVVGGVNRSNGDTTINGGSIQLQGTSPQATGSVNIIVTAQGVSNADRNTVMVAVFR